MTPEEAWDLLVSQPVAVLATINPDGTPHLVPFTFAAVAPRTLLTAVDSKPKRSRDLRRLSNLRSDERVTVLAHHYERDWTRLWWVRGEGRADIVEARPGDADHLISRYPRYAGQRLGPWIRIRLERVTGWSGRRD